MSETDKKLAIACRHLFKGPKQYAVLVNKSKPIDKLDSGNVYACKKCIDNWPKNEKEFLDMFATMCEHCVKERCLFGN